MKVGNGNLDMLAYRNEAQRHAALVSLYFSHRTSPELIKTEFNHPNLSSRLTSNRGKGVSGDKEGSFQWTAAVQALSVLMVRAAVSQAVDSSDEILPRLVGEKGSLAASLDYALDKQPNWLVEMFGVDANGVSLLRRFLDRVNSGCKYAGPVTISLRNTLIQDRPIRIYLNDEPVSHRRDLIFLLRELEKACGALDTEIPRQPLLASPEVRDLKKESVDEHKGLFRTPIVKLPIGEGEINIKVFEGDSGVALVGIYGDINALRTSKRVAVRVHSSCINSDVLATVDCDCRAQLLSARNYLSEHGGLLIHLNQEGRGAGLYSKFVGMAISKAHSLSSFDAYRSLSLEVDGRDYEIVVEILKDFGISAISLLTNNTRKWAALKRKGIDVELLPIQTQLTPQNFDYLYSKYHEAGHLLKEIFNPGDSIYIMQGEIASKRPKHTWIFDADDTLWEDNIYYEDFIRKFTDRIIRIIPDISRSAVRDILDGVEQQMVRDVGYGPVGFERSLRETFKILSQKYGDLGEPPNDLLEAVIPTLSQAPTVFREGAKELIYKLRALGDSVVLSMQGPIEFQFAKLFKSRSAELFDAIAISKNKNEDTIRMIISSLRSNFKETTVVASNLLGDVVPAVNMGIRAFYYRNPHSWQVLNRSDVSSQYLSIHNFEEILNLRDSAA